MTDNAAAVRILAAALGLGFAADLLLRSGPWGVNLTLATLLLVGVGAAFVRARRIAVSREAWGLTVTILLLAIAFARRDSRTLAFFDLVALIITLGLAAAALRGVPLARLNLIDHVRQVAYAAVQTAVGVFPLVGRATRWLQEPRAPAFARTRAVALGAAIASPALLAFGLLFASADPIFGKVVQGAFAFDPDALASHLVLTGFFGAISAGYLSWTVLQPHPVTPRAALPQGSPIGALPVLTGLTLTIALFSAFVVFQAAELFGGAAWVTRAAGPSYAEYARSGFFELLAVATLVLPLLLLADRALGEHLGNPGRWFRTLARVLLVLLAVIVMSALNRMRLYVLAYGLSEIRVYATAAMAYVTFLAAWLGARVIRRRRRRFAPGALVAGYVTLTALHVLNPDALIVRANLSRRGAQPFDARYAASLSADAIPPLVARLGQVDPDTRCRIELALARRWGRLARSGAGPAYPDWRTLNWARLDEVRIARRMAGLPHLSTCTAPEAK